jgi:uncharacterized protein (DUF3820 family)
MIMEEQQLPIVPFGKYKDKSVLELLADEKYVEWLKQQSWFSNQKQIYNIVVHQTISTTNNSKTPEHNKLQNLFLDKSNQQKLLSKLFKIDLIDGINNLFKDADITRCFGENIIPKFINNLDKTTIKFEDKFNWDLVIYYSDIQRIEIISNLETELSDKIKYKEQYDIEEKEKYDNEILSYEEKINIREIIDKEEIEEFENQMKNYIEKKDNNQIELNKYENELKKYCKMRINYELKKFRELCNELKISWYLNEKESNRNNYSYSPLKGKHSVSNLHSLILCVDNDKLLSEQEKKTYKTIIYDKINNIMEKWENDNISLIPNKIKKLQIPEPFNTKESINCCSKYSYNKYTKYGDVLKCSSLDNVDYLKRQKKEYENEYIKNYEKKFNDHYEKYRLQYYRDIIKKYCNNFYVEKTNENQYELSIDICHYNNAICCELKPTLSDDYPVVLRKLKTQIELTQNDKTNFKKLNKKYILIIGSFTSIDVSKEQLITIFKQSNIKVIFTDEIFETSTQVAIKCVNRNTTTEQVLFENKLIEENKFLTDNLLQTQQKLLQAEEKMRHLEEEIQSLKSQKQSKSIKDYFGKK